MGSAGPRWISAWRGLCHFLINGKLRFIEVKGRVSGAATITATRNEILYSLNKPEDFILGIVEFQDGGRHRAHYVRRALSA